MLHKAGAQPWRGEKELGQAKKQGSSGSREPDILLLENYRFVNPIGGEFFGASLTKMSLRSGFMNGVHS